MAFKFYLRVVAAAVVALFVATGCKDSGTDDPSPTPPPTYTFEVSVSDVTDVSASVKPIPNNDLATSYCGVVTKELFDTFDSDQAFLKNDFEELKSNAYKDGIDFNNYLELVLSTGQTPSRFLDLEPETEYYGYVYGITLNGEVTSALAKEAFTTEASKAILSFEVDVTAITTSGATVAVEPSNNRGIYYFDVFEKVEMDKYASDAEIIAALKESEDFDKGLVSGKQSYTYSEQNKPLKPTTTYYAYAFEYGNPNVPSPVITKEEFTTKTPVAPSYEGWLGKWQVTSTSSLMTVAPLTFEVEISQKEAGKSYTVKGWSITNSRQIYSYEGIYVAKTDKDYKEGTFLVKSGQALGAADGDGFVPTFMGYYDNANQNPGAPAMVVNGEFYALEGTLTAEGEATVIAPLLPLQGGQEVQMDGADIFRMNTAQRQFGHYPAAEGYTNQDYPLGPYTLIKTGDPGPTVDLTFDISITDITDTSMQLSVTPSNNTDTYFCTSMHPSWIESSDAMIIAGLEEMLSEQSTTILAQVKSGTVTGLVEDLTPGSKYLVVAFGYNESGATTVITREEFRTTGGLVSDMTFDISVTDITMTGAKVTVTPSKDTDSYYFDVLEKTLVDELTDDQLIEMVSDSPTFIEYLSNGEDSFTYENAFTPGTKYYAYAFGYDESGVSTTEVTKKEFSTETPVVTEEYSAWLGTWTVTSASSEKSGDPVSFDVTFAEKIPGYSYNLTGWSVTDVRTNPNYVAEAKFDTQTNGFTIQNEQRLGQIPQGIVAFCGRAFIAEEKGMFVITGAGTAVTGTMAAGGGSGTAVGGPVKIGSFAETIFTSLEFCVLQPSGQVGYYDFAEGYADAGFPKGPYTLTKKSAQAAPAYRSGSLSSVLNPVFYGKSLATRPADVLTLKSVPGNRVANSGKKSGQHFLIDLKAPIDNGMTTLGRTARYMTASGVVSARESVMSLRPLREAEVLFKSGIVRR